MAEINQHIKGWLWFKIKKKSYKTSTTTDSKNSHDHKHSKKNLDKTSITTHNSENSHNQKTSTKIRVLHGYFTLNFKKFAIEWAVQTKWAFKFNM